MNKDSTPRRRRTVANLVSAGLVLVFLALVWAQYRAVLWLQSGQSELSPTQAGWAMALLIVSGVVGACFVAWLFMRLNRRVSSRGHGRRE